MRIRLMGLPDETTRALTALRGAEGLDLVSVSTPLPCRGESREVRVYIEARLAGTGDGGE